MKPSQLSNSKCFCTILTAKYMPFALALNDSLLEYNKEVSLNILISDQSFISDFDLPTNVRAHFYTDLCDAGIGKEIAKKYHSGNHNVFRWSMKPVYLNYLLQSSEQVIYVDCDIQFVSNYDFLFDLLNTNNILLSPHFRSSDPIRDKPNFLLQYYAGLFNGGFVGASKGGQMALNWWADACLHICELNPSKGQFMDQTHLNLLPIFFEGIHILKHRGCNVANWNQLECKRELIGDRILILGEFEIVFIHFTSSTIGGIMSGKDGLLLPYVKKYEERLKSHGWKVSLFNSGLVKAKPNVHATKRAKNKLIGLYKRFLRK
jgi:hypothetical protein